MKKVQEAAVFTALLHLAIMEAWLLCQGCGHGTSDDVAESMNAHIPLWGRGIRMMKHFERNEKRTN